MGYHGGGLARFSRDTGAGPSGCRHRKSVSVRLNRQRARRPQASEWGDDSGSRFATPWVTDTEICARGQQTKIRVPAHDLIIGSRVGSPAPPRAAPLPAFCTVATTRWVPGSSALAVWVRSCGSTPMMTTNDLRPRHDDGERDRGRQTCRLPAPVAGTPLIESGHSPRHRPARQALAEPTRTRQAVHQPSRSMPRRDARSPSPARPVHLLQVGGSVSALAAWHTSHGSLA